MWKQIQNDNSCETGVIKVSCKHLYVNVKNSKVLIRLLTIIPLGD